MVTAKKGTKATKLVDLTDEEVRALPKPRDGFHEQAEGLLVVRAKFGDALSSAKVEPAKVRATIAAVKQLEATIAPLKKQLELLEETRLLLNANAWSDLLEIYGVAQVVAKKDAKVAKAIEPFAKFMSLGPKKKKAEGAGEKK